MASSRNAQCVCVPHILLIFTSCCNWCDDSYEQNSNNTIAHLKLICHNKHTYIHTKEHIKCLQCEIIRAHIGEWVKISMWVCFFFKFSRNCSPVLCLLIWRQIASILSFALEVAIDLVNQWSNISLSLPLSRHCLFTSSHNVFFYENAVFFLHRFLS